ncbi:cytochrome P450 [Boletus reticuloceps]|uniref:Cytochrome P450 n=1 Tax=Boletus reticuloceps TaxID=495285 RepID=A0A8I3A840_9AGAM|nr:cytochrome P450 [Boletus reticuloceps]
MIHIRPYQWYAFDAGVTCIAIWTLLQWSRTTRRKLRTTQLRGPPSESFLYGVGKRILDAEDSGAIYEAWALEYGPVYAVPSTLGSKRIVLCDPKAIAHFYAKETWSYIQTPLTKKSTAIFIGKGLLWAHGEDHRRQRRSLTPAFSVAAIRQLTSIFYDSAYKAKGAWDTLIESSDGDNALIDVQNWMNHISLDTIGLAGFSHNFGALEGKHASVTEVFDTFGTSPRSTTLNKGLLLLGLVFPFLASVPTRRGNLIQKLNVAMGEILTALLAKTQKEMEVGVVGGKEERSIIGLLIKGVNNESEFHLTQEEVMAQMRVLLVAGYETTSVSLSWALLELSRNPDIQTKLRKELLEHGADPTYDQLTNGLPHLDAVVHEILRIHPPVVEFTRVAIEDDVVPLSEPIRTQSGEIVDSLTIAKGTLVAISMECMNRSSAIWGEDAKIFRPSRWFENGENGIPAKAKEIQGHRHLLTFVDGPRMCLGKNFAVTEFKAVLTVLVKNFVFELRDGVDSKIEIGRGLLPRPKIAGEEGCKLPLRVRPYVA